MLIIHIVFSLIGIIGSYLRLVKKASAVTSLGLFGVIVSGIFLFIQEPQKFMDSPKFLSNMTVILILVVVEFIYLINKSKLTALWLDCISAFSWTWVFLVAILSPNFSYPMVVLAYIIVLLLTLIAIKISGILNRYLQD